MGALVTASHITTRFGLTHCARPQVEFSVLDFNTEYNQRCLGLHSTGPQQL